MWSLKHSKLGVPKSVLDMGALQELKPLTEEGPCPLGICILSTGEQNTMKGLQQEKKECLLPRPSQHVHGKALVIR